MESNELYELAKELSILIVEDDEDVRSIIKDLAGLFFKEVDEAANGNEGLQKSLTKRHDIVLSDITMPLMDGFEMIESIKAKNSSQKVILLSAHHDREYLQKAIELGVDGFIAKPIQKEQFLKTLIKVVKQIEAERLVKNYQKELETRIEETKQELKRVYYTDKITNLPNREALYERLTNAEDNDALILIDIHNFSSINLVYGEMGGNFALKMLGEFLNGYGKAYYIGSDNFVLLVEKQAIKKVAEQILEDVKDFAVEYEGNRIEIPIRVALSCQKPLLRTAAVELKELKKTNKSYGYYTKNLATEQLHIKVQKYLPLLKKAIKNDWIVPFFQPIVDNETEEIVKYEALVRIVDEDGNIYPAFDFIEVAKLSGLVSEITKIMIKKVFAKAEHNAISINLDELDLQDEEFFPYLAKMVEQYNINPQRITFEILENVHIGDVNRIIEAIGKLKSMGFLIAIDDFGAQCSNFERVHSINADIIKIDGKYIKDIAQNEKSYNITKTIHSFAQSMDAKVVAEFVSDDVIYKRIRELGIDYSQGYYFAPPRKDMHGL